jgi:hypothetical protein
MRSKGKAPGRRKKKRPAARSSRRRAQPYVREIPLQQGLQELAREGAHSIFWVAFAFSAIVIAAGLAFGAWSQRPIPEYTSGSIETGSPFDAVFRVRNTSAWFPLSHPKISCILTYAGASNLPPVPASDMQFPPGSSFRLEPGASATFSCPFRTVLRGTLTDELGTALKSELFFRNTYDLPLGGSWHLTDGRGPFVLNTRLLPPRWTTKP